MAARLRALTTSAAAGGLLYVALAQGAGVAFAASDKGAPHGRGADGAIAAAHEGPKGGGKTDAPGHAKKGDGVPGPATSPAPTDLPRGSEPAASDPVMSPQPPSNADRRGGGANGQCPGAAYCSTRDGSPSGNGNGKGKAVGKPCAGCVGKADNKDPRGQAPNGSDHNSGYECDGNSGVGRTNPAHTGCAASNPKPPAPSTRPTPPGTHKPPTTHQQPAGHNPPATRGTRRPAVRATTQVLGEQVTRARPLTQAGVLPFTGMPLPELLLFAGLTVLLGGGLVLATRRGSQEG